MNQTEVTAQEKYKRINLKLIEDISENCSLDKTKLGQLLAKMRLRIDSSAAQRFLIMARASDPESFLDAFYRYSEDDDAGADQSRNISRFGFYLINSKRSRISLAYEASAMGGMFDEIDDSSTLADLDYTIGVLENEDY